MNDETTEVKSQGNETVGPAEDFFENPDSDIAEIFNDSAEEVNTNDAAAITNSASANQPQQDRRGLNEIAQDFAIAMYRFAAGIRQKGHATLADMIFRDTMQVNLAANTASGAIGRERFIGCLEEGYYASGRVIEYLRFAALCEIGSSNLGELMDVAETIHKIYAVSIKTATGKNKKSGKEMKNKVYM